MSIKRQIWAQKLTSGGSLDGDYEVVTTVGDPGSDDNLATEKAVREALDVIANTYVRAEYYESVSGTSGTLTEPSGNASATYLDDFWGAGLDAICVTISGGLPTDTLATTAGGTIVTVTLDTATGAYTLSAAPDAYPVAVIFAYRCKFVDFDDAQTLNGEADIEDFVRRSETNWTDLTDGGDTTLHIHDSRYFTETELGSTGTGHTSGSDLIGIPIIAGATNTSAHEFMNLFGSAGRCTGGTISAGAGITVNVAGGTGFIKATDVDTAELLSFDWAASNGHTIPTNSTRYIGVKYGTPPIVDCRETQNWDYDTEWPLGSVINLNDTLYILNNPWWVTDGMTNIIEKMQGLGGYLARDAFIGGLILGVTGTRNPTMSAGTVWGRTNEFEMDAINYSTAGSFNTYWFESDGTVHETTLTYPNAQYPITQWNDIDNDQLDTIGNNQYAVWWVFLNVTNNQLAFMYPKATYATSATAEAEELPSHYPADWYLEGLIVGRVLIKQGVDAPVVVQSAFTTQFTAVQAADHANLSNLPWSTAGHTIDADIAMGTNKLTGLKVPADAGDSIRATAKITEALLESATDLKHTQGTDTALGAVGTKNPPVDADKVIYRDSTDSDALVTSTWTQVKAFLKTYFDTLYNKYVHPNHSGDVTSVADGAQTIVNKQTMSATAPITLSNTPIVIAGDTPVIAIPAATDSVNGYATSVQIAKLDGIEAGAEVNNISDANVLDLTDGGDTTLHDHDGISENTAARHTQGTDVALGAVGTKDPPIDADKAIYRDSTDSDVLVTSTWAQVKAFLKTYFDTLYNKYVHPNHSGDVTSTADGAQVIVNMAGKYIYRADGTDVPIVDGGTGQSTAQAAIDALTAVGAATNEHVLTKDTATGNAKFKAATGGITEATAIKWAIVFGGM